MATTRQRSFKLSEKNLRLLEDGALLAASLPAGLPNASWTKGYASSAIPDLLPRGRGRSPAGPHGYPFRRLASRRDRAPNSGDTSAAADFLAVSERQVSASLDYYADLKPEVDAWAHRQREIAAVEQEAFRRRQAALE